MYSVSLVIEKRKIFGCRVVSVKTEFYELMKDFIQGNENVRVLP